MKKMQVNFAGNKGSFRLKEILEEKNNELPQNILEPKTERTGITESTGTVPRRKHGPYSPISQPITLHKETRV
jgi:hypothetical protein